VYWRAWSRGVEKNGCCFVVGWFSCISLTISSCSEPAMSCKGFSIDLTSHGVNQAPDAKRRKSSAHLILILFFGGLE
jgi:hypothetical protein